MKYYKFEYQLLLKYILLKLLTTHFTFGDMTKNHIIIVIK